MTPKSDSDKRTAYQMPRASIVGRIDELTLSMLEKLPDTQLMEALVAGHGNVMEVLFDRYHRLVLMVALKILRNWHEAEDVMQTVFLEVYRQARLFNPSKGTFKVWLLQYAYHRSFNRRESLIYRKYWDHCPLIAAEHLSSEAFSQFSLFAEAERLQILRRAMECLSEKQRTTLKLAIFEGLLVKEIAERINESPERVSNWYFRGLKKLRSAVHELMNNGKVVSFSHNNR